MFFRLKVFKEVAEQLSFTSAAEKLYISQPAVSKHISSLENILNTKLFYRKGNTIVLTESGKVLLRYVYKFEQLNNEMNFEINAVNNQIKGKLKIGASTTIAQYILPEILAKFKNFYPDLHIQIINGNTCKIENELSKGKIDLGLIEGRVKKKEYQHQFWLKDEIVFTVNIENPLAKKEWLNIRDIQNIPLLIRESGSGTLDVIKFHLNQHQIKLSDLKIDMEIGSTEAIKNFLLQNPLYGAFLSIHSILPELQNKKLAILDIDSLQIERDLNIIFLPDLQSKTNNLFINFIKHYNF